MSSRTSAVFSDSSFSLSPNFRTGLILECFHELEADVLQPNDQQNLSFPNKNSFIFQALPSGKFLVDLTLQTASARPLCPTGQFRLSQMYLNVHLLSNFSHLSSIKLSQYNELFFNKLKLLNIDG